MKAVDLGQIDYDGSQLHHAFAYEEGGELGATICYFEGAANVLEHLVDLEDFLAHDFIKSELMQHFIIEVPEATITEMVVWQRFFICMCIDVLRSSSQGFTFTRKGDDIMVGPNKLSVSIATLSRFSGLIHVGINISVGDGCPVAAIGIADLITDSSIVNEFGKTVAQKFVNEYEDIKAATYKVIEV